MKTKPYLGILRLCSNGQYYFWCHDDTKFEVAESDAPIETPLEVYVRDNKIIEWKRDTSVPWAFRDETRKDIALVGLTESNANLDNVKENNRWGAQQLQNHLRWVGGHVWDVTVTPYIFVVESLQDFGFSGNWTKLKEMIAEVNPKNKHNYWHQTGVWVGGGIAGVAFTGGDIAVTYDSTNLDILIHEQGHCFGLGHHRSHGSSSEYGGYSWMGLNGWSYAAPNMHYMGLLEEENIKTGHGRYFLVDPSTQPQAMSTREDKLVYIDIGGITHSVSLHKNQIKIDQHISGADAKIPWASAKYFENLTLGNKWENIKFERFEKGVAEIAVGNPSPESFPVIQLPSVSEPMEGKTGVWYNPNYSHQGFDTYILDGRVIAYWYTWDGKNPRWLLLDGQIEDNIAYMSVLTPQPGNYTRKLVNVGEAKLYFTDENNGKIHYYVDMNRVLSGKGVIPLQRLTTKQDHSLYGVYEFDGEKNEGISVTVNKTPNGNNRVIGYWYGYKGTGSGTYSPWWLIDGIVGEEMTVYEPSDGMLNINTTSKLTEIGKCTLSKRRFSFKNKNYRLIRLI